ncbi:putative quinol monooxygenase [Streptomyces sp. CBMA123]|uniref:putative quinol monooxygenase n=1 Tax=Streptomyces sp. CBMA123 TaxID=1896313 RepID=UPI001661963C|nr:putative quinol monooxygenase [Streptomyces sp. CBMA123]MBD0689913.1 hypothetical protein [Streptomyces sp. CBMA123]
MPIVIATLRTKPGHRDEVLAAFEQHTPAIHAEPGCELYAVHAGPDRVTVVEKWSDQATLDAHSAGAPLAALGAVLAAALAEPADVAVLDAFPAGEPAKGLV